MKVNLSYFAADIFDLLSMSIYHTELLKYLKYWMLIAAIIFLKNFFVLLYLAVETLRNLKISLSDLVAEIFDI